MSGTSPELLRYVQKGQGESPKVPRQTHQDPVNSVRRSPKVPQSTPKKPQSTPNTALRPPRNPLESDSQRP